MSTRLKDGVIAQEGMTVYGMSPWGELETLYVEPDTKFASTIFPSDDSGAAHCRFLTANCYSDRWAAEVAKPYEASQGDF